jgi:hypothetical protein
MHCSYIACINKYVARGGSTVVEYLTHLLLILEGIFKKGLSKV